jgi:hypothetical protein
MTARGERATRRSSTPVAGTRTTRRTPQPKTTPRTRTRLRLDTGDDVDVSSSVRIAAADDEESDGADQGSQEHPEDEGNAGQDDGHEDDEEEQEDDQRGDAGAPSRPTAAALSNQAGNDDNFESMGWWGALTPGQQRSMMRRFLVQPPTAAPATPTPQHPIVIQAPAAESQRKPHVKSLKIDDFKGQANKSVEAWLATIPQEVERQASLGGET